MRFDAVKFLESLFDPARAVSEPEPTPVRPEPMIEPGIRPDDLRKPWRELYEERAAIREYEGGQAREHAEAEALRETVAMMRAAVNAT